MPVRHSDVCRGGTCGCCPGCGQFSYAASDGRCLYCFPPRTDAPAAKPKTKTPAPKVKANGRLVSIKPNSRSRAPEAKRREALYGQQFGLTIGSNDDINHA